MLFVISMIALGGLLLTFSSVSINKIIVLIGRERHTQVFWRRLLYLTIFFIFGYLAAILFIFVGLYDILFYIVGLVFLSSSFFVFFVTRISLYTIRDMEKEIQDRTYELSLSREVAQNANQAKSNFLAVMSHEMRTPLTSIIAASELLMELSLTKSASHYIDIIKRAAKNLFEQINNILDLSKIEAGKLILENRSMSIHEITLNVLAISEVQCKKKGIFLKADIDIPDGLSVLGDSKHFEQVLMNLMSNAIKFTDNGSITLSIKKKEEVGNNIILKFSVADTGAGISADNIKNIFESFSQADQGINRRFSGTGIGLCICNRIIEKLGGTINVHSILDVGTTFSFSLCFEKAKRQLKNVDTNKNVGSQVNKMHILLVEDNEDNRFLLTTFMKAAANVQVDTAENGAIAVEEVLHNTYDLIFMDFQMPVMDGLTATARIREWEKSMRVMPATIVALSANVSREGMLAGLKAGCNEHLCKPVRKKDLLNTIEHYRTASRKVNYTDRTNTSVSKGKKQLKRKDQINFTKAA